jgi:hypothetical protein
MARMQIRLVDHVEPRRPERDHQFFSDGAAIDIQEALRSLCQDRTTPAWRSRFQRSSFSFPAGTRSMDSPHPHALFWFGLLNTNFEARRSTL